MTTILNSPVCLGCLRKKGTHTNRKIGFTGVPWKWPFLFFYSFPVRFSLHNPVGGVGLAIIFFLFLLELNSRRSSGTCPLVLTVLFVKNFGGNTHHVTHYLQYLSYYIIFSSSSSSSSATRCEACFCFTALINSLGGGGGRDEVVTWVVVDWYTSLLLFALCCT